jgi:hypothetical protein
VIDLAGPCRLQLHRAVQGLPAGKDLATDRGDDGNGRHDDQAGDEGVFQHLATLLNFDTICFANFFMTLSFKRNLFSQPTFDEGDAALLVVSSIRQ